METSITERLPTATSVLLNPTLENSSTELLLGTEIVKLPDVSEVVTVVPPLTLTVTEEIDWFVFSFVTRPVTWRACVHAKVHVKQKKNE
jgi:hypothetical protein